MDRVILIRRSLLAFACGAVGLVPLLGLVPAVYAISFWWRVRKQARNEWNPAGSYLNWAAVLGFLGVLNTGLTVYSIAQAFILSLI